MVFYKITTAIWLAIHTALASTTCLSDQRLAGAELVVHSYNLVAPGESAASFSKLPVADGCTVFINPDGLPGIQFAVTGSGTIDFAILTRQVFSKVTGEYSDYENGTNIIHTNVTLGALHLLEVPVTFFADVFLFYDLADCLIREVRAFGQIPTEVLGILIHPPDLGGLLSPLDL